MHLAATDLEGLAVQQEIVGADLEAMRGGGRGDGSGAARDRRGEQDDGEGGSEKEGAETLHGEEGRALREGMSTSPRCGHARRIPFGDTTEERSFLST
jgi:hypothetical protein